MIGNFKNLNPDQFLRYVQKSSKLKEIRSYISETEEGAALLKELHSALISQNATASIFSHEHAIMLAQILFEENRISENARMSIFLYLTILRTYTDKQALREEDKDTKVLCNVEAITSNDSRYKNIIIEYLGNVFSSLVNPGRRDALQVPVSKRYLFQMKPLIEKVLNSSGFEFAIFRISLPIDKEQENHLSYHSLRQHANEDIMFWAQYVEQGNAIVLPSVALFQSIVQQLNPDINFEPTPILGQIRTETLFKNFHTFKTHAVSIYSEHVKSNPSEVHGLRLGPLGVLLHDIFHITMFDVMFNEKMYEFFTFELLPFMIKLKEFFEKNINNEASDNEINNAIALLLAFLNDYLIENSQLYERIFVNIFKRINETIISNPKKPILFSILFLAFSNFGEKSLEYYGLDRLKINKIKGFDIDMRLFENTNFPEKLSDWEDKHFNHIHSSSGGVYQRTNERLTFAFNVSEKEIGLKREFDQNDSFFEEKKEFKIRKRK